MPSALTLLITWATSVNASQGGKASSVTTMSMSVLAIHVKTVGLAQTLLEALSALVGVGLLGPTVKQTSMTALQIPV